MRPGFIIQEAGGFCQASSNSRQSSSTAAWMRREAGSSDAPTMTVSQWSKGIKMRFAGL